MSPAIAIHGRVAPGFEPVREAFIDNFAHGEIGAHVAVYHRGEVVIDLRAGVADTQTKRPWSTDTLTAVFSASKGVVALAFLMAADRGELELDVPVAHYWPAFGAHGKQDITVRCCLNHRAGLHALDRPLTLREAADPDISDAAIVSQSPAWTPGEDQGYGATIWGILMASIFRHACGRDLGSVVAEEIAAPLGLEMYLGLPASHHARVSTLYSAPIRESLRRFGPRMVRGRTTEGRLYRRVLFQRKSHSRRAFLNPDPGPKRLACMNEPENRELQLPWMNVHTNASSLARMYAALSLGGEIDGVRLVRPEAITPLHATQSWSNMDRVLQKPLGFSQGFQKEERHLFSPEGSWFGHPGAGGSLGYADPQNQIAFAYVINGLSPYIRSPRAIALSQAVYRCLGIL